MEIPVLTAERTKKIGTLIKRMGKQNERDFPPVLPLIESFNIVITDEELDFLLLLGKKTYNLKDISSTGNLPADKFNVFFETLKAKGFIRVEYNEKNEEIYDLNAIIVGWREAQVHYLKDKPEEMEFARKLQGDGKNKKAFLKMKKCTGCGQCVFQCPQNIPELVQKEREVFLPIIKKSETRIHC